MSAFNGVQYCFNRPLADVARSLHYSEANIAILEGNENALKNKFPEVYSNLLSCKHHADARTPFQYGQDLVASWLFEDTFLLALEQSESFSISLDGADKGRAILPSAKTSAASDYKITTASGIVRNLELMCDYTGFWARTGKLHLRDEKFTKMQATKSIFIAVSVTTKEFAVYDFSAPIQARYIASHRLYGGKPAYELDISSNMMKSYTSINLTQAIENTVGE